MQQSCSNLKGKKHVACNKVAMCILMQIVIHDLISDWAMNDWGSDENVGIADEAWLCYHLAYWSTEHYR